MQLLIEEENLIFSKKIKIKNNKLRISMISKKALEQQITLSHLEQIGHQYLIIQEFQFLLEIQLIKGSKRVDKMKDIVHYKFLNQ